TAYDYRVFRTFKSDRLLERPLGREHHLPARTRHPEVHTARKGIVGKLQRENAAGVLVDAEEFAAQ
ncbi:MAG: hypothetical protein ACP5PN_12480, partial [Steroidobacteraceae bacterium]